MAYSGTVMPLIGSASSCKIFFSNVCHTGMPRRSLGVGGSLVGGSLGVCVGAATPQHPTSAEPRNLQPRKTAIGCFLFKRAVFTNNVNKTFRLLFGGRKTEMDTDYLTPMAYDCIRLADDATDVLRSEIGAACSQYPEDEALIVPAEPQGQSSAFRRQLQRASASGRKYSRILV